ncbi:MAG: TraR/DksA family transcriptional regulator [Actinomycetota bacterium]
MDDDQIQLAAKRLREEQAVVHAELADLGFAVGEKVDVHFDDGFADAAQTTSELNRVMSLADGLRQRLEEIDGALHRVDSGTYGKCESCGKDIPPERLEAIPAASMCITCKQKAFRFNAH